MMGEATGFIFEIFRDGEQVGRIELDQAVIKVGSHDKSHLVLDDPQVSRVHAVLERQGDGAQVIDLGSGRGTFVNGERVNKATLKHGDRLRFGDTEVRFLTQAQVKASQAKVVVPDEVRYARRFLARPATTDGSVEVAVLFRDFVLAEEIFQPPTTLTFGSDEKATFGVEHPTLREAFPLVKAEAEGKKVSLCMSADMIGDIYVGRQRHTVASAISEGVARPQSGGRYELELSDETRARFAFGDVVVFIHRSTRPVLALPAQGGRGATAGYLIASLILHLLFLALVYLLPPDVGRLSMDGFDAQNRFVQMLMQDEMEEEPDMEPDWLEEEEEDADEAAAGEEGRAGDERVEEEEEQRMAVEAPSDATPEEIELAREAVQDRGALQVLEQMGPTSLFGDQARGFDDIMAIGSVTGDETGASYGMQGLGRYGGGLSAGGIHTRAGIDAGPLALAGRDSARLEEARRAVQVTERRAVEVAVREGNPEIRGQLDREIIQRVIRTHRREVRACYEQELQRNPNIRGRVTVRFVIAPDGSVAQSEIANSALNSPPVESCLTRRIRQWRFPEPRGGGIVRVEYPFDFTF